jgi:hypothetical protein
MDSIAGIGLRVYSKLSLYICYIAHAAKNSLRANVNLEGGLRPFELVKVEIHISKRQAFLLIRLRYY